MDKPNHVVFSLMKIGVIHGLRIDQHQTGTDTADTFAVITGGTGKLEGLWRTYDRFLDVTPDHNSVCRVKREYAEQFRAWKEFERENAKELAEYERLKAKFGEVKS